LPNKNLIGEVTYIHVEKGIVKVLLIGKLGIGDTIIIEKGSKQTKLKVENLAIEGIDVKNGFGGDTVEVKINQSIEVESSVYKL
jgi:hypothetical protein